MFDFVLGKCLGGGCAVKGHSSNHVAHMSIAPGGGNWSPPLSLRPSPTHASVGRVGELTCKCCNLVFYCLGVYISNIPSLFIGVG